MKEKEIQSIIDMNYRCLMLLGYSMSFMHSFHDRVTLTNKEEEKYLWLMHALENVIYFDKPLPESP